MVKLADTALDELQSRSETMTVHDLVRIVETYHSADRPGVAHETLEAYLDALEYDSEEVSTEIDTRLTDASEWQSDDAIYDLGEDRISVFPPAWHEKLGDTTDLTEYVKVIRSDVDETQGTMEEAVTETGVPEQFLLRVMGAIGGVEREQAREQLATLRREGVVEESADQHPSGTVRLA